MDSTKQFNENQNRVILYDLMVVFILLHFFGFPGKLATLFGSGIETMIDYGCFGLQIVVMLLSSGGSFMDVKLLDLKPQYRIVYFYALFLFLEGVYVATDRKAEVITCLRMLTTVLFGLWLLQYYDVNRFLQLAYSAQVLFVLATLGYIVLFRNRAFQSYEGERALVGLYGAKNSMASELAFGLLIQTTLLRVKLDRDETVSLRFLLMGFVQLVLLVLTKGTGSLLVTIISVFYLFAVEKQFGKERRLPLGFFNVISSVGFLLFALTIIPLFEPVLEMLGKDATLTGRIPLWERIIEITMDHRPLTGYGYERLWKEKEAVDLIHAGFAETSWFSKMTAGSHSLLVELLGSTGVLGLGFFYLMILFCFSGVKRMPEESYVYTSAIMISFTLHCLTERGMAPSSYYTLFFFTALGAACQYRRMRNREGVVRHG